jgi:microcystin-dependent protein
MAQPYVGEIRMFAGNFAPVGWMFCEGQQLAISENETLYQLIGTTYGGDGQSTFHLPDMRGRVPMHQGTGPGLSGHGLGEALGVETVTLTVSQIPQHRHAPVATTNRASAAYTGKTGVLASTGGVKVYGLAGGGTSPMRQDGASLSSVAGGSQPHTNMAPSLGLNYIISLFGLFPSPT